MPHWRKISSVRVVRPRPFGKRDVEEWLSMSMQLVSKRRNAIAADRPTGPPPTINTGTSSMKGSWSQKRLLGRESYITYDLGRWGTRFPRFATILRRAALASDAVVGPEMSA